MVLQVIILLRDGSLSMEGAKAREASAACTDLTKELAKPANKDGFRVGVVDFGETATVVHKPEKASQLAGRLKEISADGDSTNLTSGLEKALELLDRGPHREDKDYKFLRPVVLAFTDGCHNSGPGPESVVETLKERADLVTVAFGEDADEDLLRRIATTEQHMYRCRNGAELRAFLASVGETMSVTRPRGENATAALGRLSSQ